jgi:hypothetical protein
MTVSTACGRGGEGRRTILAGRSGIVRGIGHPVFSAAWQAL